MDNKNIDDKYKNHDGSTNWGKVLSMIVGVGVIGGIIYAVISNLL